MFTGPTRVLVGSGRPSRHNVARAVVGLDIHFATVPVQTLFYMAISRNLTHHSLEHARVVNSLAPAQRNDLEMHQKVLDLRREQFNAKEA